MPGARCEEYPPVAITVKEFWISNSVLYQNPLQEALPTSVK